ncbi:MAG: hypothetical protein ABFQ65_01615 [Nanoarchaeota archaeon]
MSVVKFSWNKKGISIMIGYILLITSAVVMSAIVYQWMKSYVPKDAIDCPDGVSIFITDSTCTKLLDNTYELRINIRNNGRFDVGGYFIHATDREDQELAAVDLSDHFVTGGQVINNVISFIPDVGGEVKNYFNPGDDDRLGKFNYTKKLYSIEVIPIRYQVMDNKKQLVSCGKAKIIENLNCDPVLIVGVCGDGTINIGEQCDDSNIVNGDGCDSNCQTECTPDCTGKDCGDDGCGGTCPDTCVLPEVCEVNTCVATCTLDSDCDVGAGEVCVSNVCQLCGNGVVDGGEECDSVVGCGGDCVHLSGYNCFPSTNTCYPI